MKALLVMIRLPNKHRIVTGFTAFLLLLCLFTTTLSTTVLADTQQQANDSSTNPDDWNPITRAKRWAYLTGLYNCLDDRMAPIVGSYERNSGQSDISSGNWWNDPSGPRDRFNEPASYIDISTKDNGNGKSDCNNIVGATAEAYSLNPIQLFCDLGGKRQDGSPCINSGSKSDFNWPSDHARLDLTKWWGQKDLPQSAGGAAYYELNYYALMDSKGCNLKEQSNASGNFAYTLNIVDDGGKVTPTQYTGQSQDHTINVYTSYPGINDQSRDCKTIASDLNKWSTDYAQWMRKYNPTATTNAKGYTGGDTSGGSDTSSCQIGGIGWIICPVMNFMAQIVDGTYGIVASLLNVQPLTTSGGSDQSLYQAWGIMRSFANIAFVIAFMIIIYSQLTGFGITNYGIKKMLPKLIVAAILVNISYWICSVAVDISNILGYSLKSLFDNLTVNIKVPDNAFSSGGSWWTTITGSTLAGAGIGALSLYAGLSVLLPALVVAIMAIVTVFLVLTLRQALIILLVVISPLAFVAYLLPNTEIWFKKWRELFQTLLLMFPIIAVIFGASAFASKIVMASATGDYKFAIQVMGALITVIPLALTPIIMKTAGGLLGRFGGLINNPNRGPFDRMKKGAANIRERQQNRRAIRSMNGGRVFGGGQFRRKAEREAIDNSLKQERKRLEGSHIAEKATQDAAFAQKLAGAGPLGRGADAAAIQRAVESAQFTIDEAEIKEAKAARVTFERGGMDGMGAYARLQSDAPNMTAAQRTALRSMVVEAGNADHIEKLWNDSGNMEQNERNAFAADVAKNKPTGVGLGDIAGMRSGSGSNFRDIIAKGAAEGRYDPQGSANADTSELRILEDILKNDSQRLSQAASAANTSSSEVIKQVAAAANTAATDGRYQAGKSAPALRDIAAIAPRT